MQSLRACTQRSIFFWNGSSKHLVKVDYLLLTRCPTNRGKTKYWSLIEVLSVAHANHGALHFSQGAIICWAVIERLLHVLWEEDLCSNVDEACLEQVIRSLNTNVRVRSRYKGVSSKNYKSVLLINVLNHFNIIDEEMTARLHSLRKARNDWVHEIKEIEFIEAAEALNTSVVLLNRKLPIQLKWYANTSWYAG